MLVVWVYGCVLIRVFARLFIVTVVAFFECFLVSLYFSSGRVFGFIPCVCFVILWVVFGVFVLDCFDDVVIWWFVYVGFSL